MLSAAVALFVLGFNDTSTLVGHFVSSPREREKRDSVLGFNDTSTLVDHFVSSPRERERRDSRGDEREGQGRKRNWNERAENRKNKQIPWGIYVPRLIFI